MLDPSLRSGRLSQKGLLRSLGFGWALLAFLVLVAAGAQAKEVPYLAGRVNDLANLLPPDAEARVEQSLEALENATGTQVVVLTVPSLEGDPLEDYTLRVAETWKLGRGDFDDGALFFIARDDRKLRLEVGYGLEPTLPDLKSRRILDEIVLPKFRGGDFGGGIEAGVETIAGIVSGESDLPPPSRGSGSGSDRSAPIFFLIIAMFFAQMLGAFPKKVAWALYLLGAPLGWMVASFFFGSAVGIFFLLAWLILFPVLRLFSSRRPPGSSGHGRGPFGGSVLGSGGGWSSGGGFGGGFSGGGGGFGGGGASSGW